MKINRVRITAPGETPLNIIMEMSDKLTNQLLPRPSYPATYRRDSDMHFLRAIAHGYPTMGAQDLVYFLIDLYPFITLELLSLNPHGIDSACAVQPLEDLKRLLGHINVKREQDYKPSIHPYIKYHPARRPIKYVKIIWHKTKRQYWIYLPNNSGGSPIVSSDVVSYVARVVEGLIS